MSCRNSCNIKVKFPLSCTRKCACSVSSRVNLAFRDRLVVTRDNDSQLYNKHRKGHSVLFLSEAEAAVKYIKEKKSLS